MPSLINEQSRRGERRSPRAALFSVTRPWGGRNGVQRQGSQNRNQISRTQGTSHQGTEQKANKVADRVAEQAQSTFENAREKVSTQFQAVARAIETAAHSLDQQEQTGLSRRVQQYVRKAENGSQYLRDKSPRELKSDLEDGTHGVARAERAAWTDRLTNGA